MPLDVLSHNTSHFASNICQWLTIAFFGNRPKILTVKEKLSENPPQEGLFKYFDKGYLKK